MSLARAVFRRRDFLPMELESSSDRYLGYDCVRNPGNSILYHLHRSLFPLRHTEATAKTPDNETCRMVHIYWLWNQALHAFHRCSERMSYTYCQTRCCIGPHTAAGELYRWLEKQ